MSDDLLKSFRADVPPPDAATAKRAYARATSRGGPRQIVTRRRLVPAVALLAAAGIAGGLSATLGGGGGAAGSRPTLPGVGGHGGMALNPMTVDFSAANGEFTSIDLTLRSVTASPTLEVKVVRSDASQVPEANNAPSQVVFDEQVSPTVTPSTMQDVTQSTWSGTLTPSDWNGGCQNALYRIEYAFDGSYTGETAWFQCSGPAADPADPFPNHFPS